MELPFFTNLLILLVTARIFGEIFERFKQPAMIGEIIAGIVVGPSFFDIIHRTEEIKVISELGIFLLVILAGLEINIDDIIKSARGKNLIISFTAFFFPLFSGIAVGYLFGLNIMGTAFMGLCIAITALPVSIRILMDLNRIKTEIGQKLITIAIFDDVLALTILGIMLNIKDTDMTLIPVLKAGSESLLKLLVFIVLLSLTYIGTRKILEKGKLLQEAIDKLIAVLRGKEPLFALFFAFVLLFSTFTETLGLHFIVGAFFASMLLSRSLIGKHNLKAIETTTSNIAMGFLAPIFFSGIGLAFDIGSITNYPLLITIIAVSFISKFSGGYIGSRAAGYDKKFSTMIGIGLNTRGIMELVIANIAYENGLITEEVFSILVIMVILITLSTPFILKKGFERYESSIPPANTTNP